MHLPPEQSFRYSHLRSDARRTGRFRVGRFMLVVVTPSEPDEISIYFRQRLLAVLNADGEVFLDTHHMHQYTLQRLYDRILADNGYSARMVLRGLKEMTLVTSKGVIIQQNVRFATFRPDGPIECVA